MAACRRLTKSLIVTLASKNTVLRSNCIRNVHGSLRYQFRFEDTFKKTTAEIINEDHSFLTIDSYSPMGFRLNNDMNIFGPIVMFPKTVLHWNVSSAADIHEDSLSLFTVLEPKLDILVIGKGDRDAEVSPMVRKYLNNKLIGLELLPTDQAIALLNYLISEKRIVAGALIPPLTLAVTDVADKSDLDVTKLNVDDLEKLDTGRGRLKTVQEIRDELRQLGLAPPKALGQEDEEKRSAEEREGPSCGKDK